MRDSRRQFGTQHLLGTISAFAVSFGLLAAAINESSDPLLIASFVAFGLSFGCPVGFLIGGKNGARLGGAFVVGLLLFVYSLLPTVQ